MPGTPDERLKRGPTSLPGVTGVRRLPGEPRSPVEPALPQAELRLPGLVGSWLQGQVHCPFCLRLIETTLLGLSTLLGPALLQCRRCGRVLISHRREWRDRGAA